jgi:hypothetical protein
MYQLAPDHPLELLEFDEIGALTEYTDRKTRDAITEKVALLNSRRKAGRWGSQCAATSKNPPKTQSRFGSSSRAEFVCGSRRNPTWAWCSGIRPTANRITEAEAGVGYVFGEGIREPLRIRAGWVGAAKTGGAASAQRPAGVSPAEVFRQVTAATYHQVWWAHHDHFLYTDGRMLVWEPTL